jgi:hypothetical protein
MYWSMARGSSPNIECWCWLKKPSVNLWACIWNTIYSCFCFPISCQGRWLHLKSMLSFVLLSSWSNESFWGANLLLVRMQRWQHWLIVLLRLWLTLLRDALLLNLAVTSVVGVVGWNYRIVLVSIAFVNLRLRCMTSIFLSPMVFKDHVLVIEYLVVHVHQHVYLVLHLVLVVHLSLFWSSRCTQRHVANKHLLIWNHGWSLLYHMRIQSAVALVHVINGGVNIFFTTWR